MRLVLFISLLWVSAIKAEPAINTNYQYYSINTTSVSQLFSDLNRASPIKENGEIFHGHTNTDINWEFRWETTNEKCRISAVSTNVQITHILPKLANKNKNRELQKVWNKWYPALVKHEKNHARNAIKIAKEIEYSIRNISSQSSCLVLEKLSNDTGDRLIKKLDKLNKNYDDKTDHGRKEGAILSTYL